MPLLHQWPLLNQRKDAPLFILGVHQSTKPRNLPLFPAVPLALTLSRSHALSLSLALPLTLSLSLSLTHTLALSLSLAKAS